MKLTHVTLATVSGVVLILIMVGVYFANNFYTNSKSEKTDITLTEGEEPQTKVFPIENSIETTKVIEEQTESIRTGATLDLSGQGLQKVPQYVFQRLGIEKLDLSNNILDGALQAEVRHLTNLRVLDLSNNAFTGVPAEVGQLTKLQVLNLANNNLTGLPNEIGNLQNLITLDIRGNEYSKFDLEQIRLKLPQTTIVLVD